MTTPPSEVPPAAFWRFSIALYGADGVEPACLALQDEGGVDVVLALYSLWIGFRRGAIAPAAADRAADVSQDWARRAVRPLRAVRRDLKRGVDAVDWPPFRERVKALELDAERAQHEALERIATATPSASGSELDAALGSSATRRAVAAASFDRFAARLQWAARSDAPGFQTLLACAETLDDAGPTS